MAQGDTPITVVGNLVADPELRFTPTGLAVANFRIASTPRVYNRESGQWEDGDATFLSCNLWGKPGENLAQSARKGTLVTVVGKLRQRTYETNDGEKRTVFDVDVEEAAVNVKFGPVGAAGAPSGGAQQDPWNSAPERGGFASQDSEPPF